MDEITLADLLSHYEIKLQEASDLVESSKKKLHSATNVVDSSWAGEAANACRIKLEAITKELAEAYSEISEARSKLSIITDLLAEEEINPV